MSDTIREAAQRVSDNARVVVDHVRPTKPRWVVSDEDFSALRAALAADDSPSEHALHFDPDCEECAYLARPVAIRVPAADDSPSEGLDVERLARAMHARHPASILVDCERHDRRDAAELAALYAAALTDPSRG